ncbi:CaiB/BaiF CoA-transferase family protein [Phenylobacterium sp. LjRoot219]|uniref:CaiB/BaiF CoA transferase family protein n=1 Tax=Phenylobacterium sp. LjRoot219 TaxID=3342283 RepID=UPI003ECD2DD5
MTGPLQGLRIVELAGIGPGPFAGMMLADHGAEVIRVERPGPPASFAQDVLHRSRRSIVVDLKRPEGVEVVAALSREADGFIEGLRPGVAERLGLGPDVLLKANPRLVYGRVTGWGQDGPLAQAAGHDLNYIALSGALYALGKAGEKPPVPLNLIGDFGGGGMLLAFGMLSAILAARSSGRGQVVDAAMTEGAALLMSMFFNNGELAGAQAPRGGNVLGGAAPFYDTYETADAGFVAVAAIEPQFYAELLRLTGLADDPDFQDQTDRDAWPAAKAKLTAVFRTRTRAQWCALLEGGDACFAPVLSIQEAPTHPHNRARGTFIEAFGLVQPAPAPRYSESTPRPPTLSAPGADTDAVLRDAGYAPARIAALRRAGVVDGRPPAANQNHREPR